VHVAHHLLCKNMYSVSRFNIVCDGNTSLIIFRTFVLYRGSMERQVLLTNPCRKVLKDEVLKDEVLKDEVLKDEEQERILW